MEWVWYICKQGHRQKQLKGVLVSCGICANNPLIKTTTEMKPEQDFPNYAKS